jgi:hypothetical protein
MHALARCRARFCGQHVLAGAARPKASPAWVAVRTVKLFDKLIPEDDPETKKQKELERAIIKKKMQRSKIAEMLAAHKDKVRAGAPSAVLRRRCFALLLTMPDSSHGRQPEPRPRFPTAPAEIRV